MATPKPAPAIWTFITADVMAFGMFFVLFMRQRAAEPALFNRSAEQLDVRLGVLNTLILITSSWLVVLGVEAARKADRAGLLRCWGLAILVGAGFAVTKGIEYADKVSHGVTMLSNDFFMFYFFLTGIHFLHFLVGMAALVYLWFRARTETLEVPFFGWIESGGIYWHMVDLLWIMLFPLLYLLGRA